MSEFSDICPYSDEEAAKVFAILAEHPATEELSRMFFPEREPDFLKNVLKNIRSVDEFQTIVVSKVIEWVITHTARNFSYDGIANIKSGKCFLAMSNHRDIILDPALTQLVMHRNGLPTTQIAVGDNLLSNKYIEYLIRSNRMIKVIRGINARSLYLSSQLLSRYIRTSITEGIGSVWIAQREGRTKNGLDTTEQGLLKMLDMSGTGTFTDNFRELNIVPMSISYEYEPCDALKARELLIARSGPYKKGSREDLVSILTGLKQYKGDIHLNIGVPLTVDEIEVASACNKNDRYQTIRHYMDARIIGGYRLFKTNYIACDMLMHTYKWCDRYSAEDVEAFTDYMEKRLDTLEKGLNREELRKIFLGIYGNPVLAKERLINSLRVRPFEDTGN